MILLRSIDLESRVAELLASEPLDAADLERIADAARRFGMRRLAEHGRAGRVTLHDVAPWTRPALPKPEGQRPLESRPPSPGDGTAASPGVATAPRDDRPPLLAHDARMEAAGPTYQGRFPHRLDVLNALSAWTRLVLETLDGEAAARAQLHLAIYEIAANVLEHGKLLGAPDRSTLTVHLQADTERVWGWIQDQCSHFDPVRATLTSLAQKLAERHRRGYGIRMIHQLLDELRHEETPDGNRIHFTKRMVS